MKWWNFWYPICHIWIKKFSSIWKYVREIEKNEFVLGWLTEEHVQLTMIQEMEQGSYWPYLTPSTGQFSSK